ncbi:MAG: molybdenum cofactor guanylyltransferase [Bellilinea sp.]
MSLSIVIQAGGESQRMGANKALLPFLGVPLIERVMGRVSHLAAELLVTTNQPADFAFLGLPLFPDTVPGQGALAGLYTALSAARFSYVAVVACDMPFASPELLTYQLDCLVNEQADLVVPLTNQGYEPFHAVYRRDTCQAAVTDALQNGKKRMISWFDQVKVRELDTGEIRRFDPRDLAFLNVNTPEEFAAAEQMAQASEG